MERRRWILVGTVGLVLAAAPAARANTPRYASVGGNGTACTSATPCSISEAINGDATYNPVQPHDEVVVEPGTYGGGGVALTSELRGPPGVPLTIHGVAGSPRPVIVSSSIGRALSLRDPASTLSHVEVDQTSDSSYAIDVMQGSASDVVARAFGTNGVACDVVGKLQDAICAVSGAGATAVQASVTPTPAAPTTYATTLRGVTAWAIGPTSQGILVQAGDNTTINLTATNTIAHGTTADVDVESATSTGNASAVIDHSSYGTVTHSASRATVTAAGSATNVAAPALFVDVAHGDFHEMAASPTVNAGATDPAGTDVFGLPRTLGPAPDIGAAELAQAPTAAATGATTITDKTATLTGIVNPEGLPTTFHFVYGTTQATGSTTASSSAGAVAAGHPATAAVTKLRPGKTYFVRLVATNAGGTTVSPLAGFKTLTTFKGLTIRTRRVRPSASHKVKLSVACPKDAPTRCTGTLTLTLGSHRVGRANFRVKAGKTAALTLKLAARARASLAAHATVRVRATAKAKDGAGRSKTTKRTVTLTR
ncbi:MAG: hypothetical protein JWN32_2949 [Solirubrobacterales bacterium]|nr:hypothetical protein [Solirubrobacterales bacterium]